MIEHYVDVKVGEEVVKVSFNVPEEIIEKYEDEKDILSEVQEYVRNNREKIITMARRKLNNFDSEVVIFMETICN